MSELNVTKIENEADSSAIEINRKASHGSIVDLQKDGTTLGSITTRAGDVIQISSAGTNSGLDFAGGINPVYSGSLSDNQVDIGYSAYRFKDLYLSGGVYLGGTGAANHLDDYEEGEWTPTYNASGASPSVTYSTRQGRYRKIGNMVVVSWHLRASAYTAGSGDLQITGLPFAASSEPSIGNFGVINFEQLNFSTGRTMAVAFIAQSQDYIFFQEQGDSVDVRTLQSADLTGGIRMIRGTVTYLTDS